jgi:predicted AAA+ superfamily ATPase
VHTVLIDEVQRVPALLDGIQALVDAHPRRFRFLISGSSARKLKRGHANLLPGRVHVEYLHPLLACELGADFDLDRVLAHGSLPGLYAELDGDLRARDLRSYTDTYLREEVQAESLVRNIGGYARLLDLVAAASGRVINLHALSGDAGVSYETARRYVEVLEDTLILFRIPAWSRSFLLPFFNPTSHCWIGRIKAVSLTYRHIVDLDDTVKREPAVGIVKGTRFVYQPLRLGDIHIRVGLNIDLYVY